MKDVAALAGVGLSTVSRVVSERGVVSATKVRAVESAIAQLGFRRNDFARNLRTGTAETIGVVVTRISDPFYSSLVSAIEERAQQRDMLALVASATDDAREAERIVGRLLGRRLDGLVIVVPEDADVSFLQREIDDGLPLVFVDRPSPGLTADEVVVDNRSGAAAGVAHLVAHGHHRIACFAHATGSYTAGERIAGYRAGLEAAGIAADDDLIVTVDDDDPEACRNAVRAMDALREPPTAFLTTNSRTTKSLLTAAPALGGRALVGFDDFDTAPLMTPPTTTIAQDPAHIGEAAADLLFARIDGLTGPVRRGTLGTRGGPRGSGEGAPPSRPPGAAHIVARSWRSLLTAAPALGGRALVGFDAFDTAPLMTPPTTTTAQDPAHIGGAAADLLFARIDGLTGPVRRVTLGTRVVPRGSGEVAPPSRTP
ncbi:LacI family DNA-binding transcriptional regulator [Microbacterium gorillae]|uniref:LacI family DNA-binding transcriptional regulator n=1 Tax=Microbacterium gorillae TaxID=1231063 RepID=UPI000693C586|nr:LacI family DNA-binding transcriptional regulator [Microbacterium gorillae]